MALERLETFPCGNVPHDYLAITAGTNDLVALKPNGIDWTLMPPKGSEEFKGFSTPDTDKTVLRAADDMLVVDTEVEDTCRVSAEDGGNLGSAPAGKQLPYNDGTIATAGNHETRGEWIVDIPILVEFQAEDATGMALEGSQLFAGFQ